MVLPAGRERLREPAAGLGRAREHVGDRAAAGLAAEVGLEDRGHAVAPGQLDGRAVRDDHDDVRVDLRHRLDERVVRGRQAQMVAVVALGLVRLGQPDEDHDRVAAARDRARLVEQGGVRCLVVAPVAGRVRSVAQRAAGVVEPVGLTPELPAPW